MEVFCTPSFHADIHKLQKNNSYSRILEDVCSYLADKNISELHLTRDLITHINGKYSLNKYRVPNCLINKGKSGSYRCICVCLPVENQIYLGKIYPKTGTDGADNLDKKEYKIIAAQISKAIQENNLYVISIEKQTMTLQNKL